jgi:hypothetical protein
VSTADSAHNQLREHPWLKLLLVFLLMLLLLLLLLLLLSNLSGNCAAVLSQFRPVSGPTCYIVYRLSIDGLYNQTSTVPVHNKTALVISHTCYKASVWVAHCGAELHQHAEIGSFCSTCSIAADMAGR